MLRLHHGSVTFILLWEIITDRTINHREVINMSINNVHPPSIHVEISLASTHSFGVTLFVSGLQGPVHAEEDHPGHQQDQDHPAIRI